MADGGFSSISKTLPVPTPFMVGAISRVLNEGLDFYYTHAAHRQLPEDQYVSPHTTSTCAGNILVLRGMLHFEPGNPFLNTLRAQGFNVNVYRYSKEAEANKLRQWPENATDLLIQILQAPQFLQPNQIILGHSAGGNEEIPLRALALKKDPGRIIDVLPKNDTLWRLFLDDQKVERASRQLSQTLFLAEGAPLMGVEITLAGNMAKRHAIERFVPGLLSAISVENMEQVYHKLDLDPKKVVDGIIYSETAPLDLSANKDSRSFAAHALTQGAYRAFSPFLKRASPHDGIVPVASALVGWSGDERALREMKVHFDHLGMVEYAAAAALTIELITRLRGEQIVYN